MQPVRTKNPTKKKRAQSIQMEVLLHRHLVIDSPRMRKRRDPGPELSDAPSKTHSSVSITYTIRAPSFFVDPPSLGLLNKRLRDGVRSNTSCESNMFRARPSPGPLSDAPPRFERFLGEALSLVSVVRSRASGKKTSGSTATLTCLCLLLPAFVLDSSSCWGHAYKKAKTANNRHESVHRPADQSTCINLAGQHYMPVSQGHVLRKL